MEWTGRYDILSVVSRKQSFGFRLCAIICCRESYISCPPGQFCSCSLLPAHPPPSTSGIMVQIPPVRDHPRLMLKALPSDLFDHLGLSASFDKFHGYRKLLSSIMLILETFDEDMYPSHFSILFDSIAVCIHSITIS